MTTLSKDYAVVRYFRSGFKPQPIQKGLTRDEAFAICHANNTTLQPGEILPRLWVDIAQRGI